MGNCEACGTVGISTETIRVLIIGRSITGVSAFS